MSYGLIGTGRGKLDRSMQGLEASSAMESRRLSADDQLKTAARTQQKQMVGTGAGLGLMVGGPAGMVAGAAAGYLLNELF